MARSRWAITSLLAGALLMQAAVAAPAGKTEPKLHIGATPPSALGKERNGDVVDLGAHGGKVVIVTFWASWCGYCLRELPVLDALQRTVGTERLRIVAVNVKDSTADYRLMTRQMHDYTLLMTRDRSGGIAEDWGITSYPNLWIIDPKGRIASHRVGYGEDSLQGIVDDINRVVAKDAAAASAQATSSSETTRQAAPVAVAAGG